MSSWSIAFGDYELIVDRKALTYRLTETKTGTVWAEGLSLGWVALEDRETGAVTRHAFGEMKQFSVSEKAGPQGKRILFGLDIHGVPIDIYLICSLREIQMVVEANRDSKTHRIAEFCLLPGLCSVPDDGKSYLVIPHRAGAMLFAHGAPAEPLSLPIWDRHDGVTMPFAGAVNGKAQTNSAIALLTDSAYGAFRLAKRGSNAEIETLYGRDPERRRLDLRVICLPGGDHISVARSYREKIISENSHVTFRRKVRDNPRLERLLGSAWFQIEPGNSVADDVAFARDWKTAFPDGNAIFQVRPNPWRGHTLADAFASIDYLREQGFLTTILPINEAGEKITEIESHATSGGNVALLSSREAVKSNTSNSWKAFDEILADVKSLSTLEIAIGIVLSSDLAYHALDFDRLFGLTRWIKGEKTYVAANGTIHLAACPVPLLSVIYHDSLVFFESLGPTPHGVPMHYFLGALLMLCNPDYRTFPNFSRADDKQFYIDQMLRTYAVLGPLHRLTFTAFLTAHRFLTPDFMVEEAVYSDKTRVVINQSETETYEGEDLTLPPLGFYVRHTQMEAHDALRVGDRTFAMRSWRLARSQDGKPLEKSEDILRQEFPTQ